MMIDREWQMTHENKIAIMENGRLKLKELAKMFNISEKTATIFWNSEGILLNEYKNKGTTITGAYYAEILHRLRKLI